MKNFISLLIITFSLLIISNVESKASCSSGYSSNTITMTVGTCDYIVEVCYKCEVTNPGKAYISRFWLVDSSCTNTLDIDIVLGQIYLEISNGSFIYSNLCIDSWYGAPPCGSGYKEFIIIYSYCWQQWYRYNGDINVREYWPCDDNENCEELVKYCFDSDPPPGEIITLSKTSLDPPQSPPCELQWYEITWPSILGNKSDCFILNSVPCGIE